MKGRVLWNRLRAAGITELKDRLGGVVRRYRLQRRWRRRTQDDFRSRDLFPDTHPADFDLWKKKLFAWQKYTRHDLCSLYADRFSDYKTEILRHADRFCQHEFEILNCRHRFSGKIDWHYDWLGDRTIPLRAMRPRHVWSPASVREVRYVWELNRHQHFLVLAKAYRLSGEARYLQELCNQWRSWLETNAPFCGVNAVSSLEMALRLISWTWTLAIVGKNSELDEKLCSAIRFAIAWQADAICAFLSAGAGANNHLIGEATGLALVGCWFPEFRNSSTWRDTGFAIVFREIERQVYPDGVLKEQSLCYQRYVFVYALMVGLAARSCGRSLPNGFKQRVRAMVDFIAAWPPEDALWPIGDDDGGEALRPGLYPACATSLLLAAWQAGLAPATGTGETARAGEWAFWLNGNLDRPPALSRPSEMVRLRRFDNGGLATIETDDRTLRQFGWLDGGPMGLSPLVAHGHADTLSFWLSNEKEALLTDGGTYLYLGAQSQRSYFRGCRAHNTFVVDGQEFARSGGPFQWLATPRATCVGGRCDYKDAEAIACHDGYRRYGISVQRRLRYRSGVWSVVDVIEGHGLHRVTWFFHLGDCQSTEKPQDQRLLFSFKSADLTVHWKSRASVEARLEKGGPHGSPGWISPAFGRSVPRYALVFEITAPLPIALITRWNAKDKLCASPGSSAGSSSPGS
ncbi:alginate lyase family protein [candidate division KSB1 bacterium]|nr:alginate lyase family protein [candidate division KSB1 bacterium]